MRFGGLTPQSVVDEQQTLPPSRLERVLCVRAPCPFWRGAVGGILQAWGVRQVLVRDESVSPRLVLSSSAVDLAADAEPELHQTAAQSIHTRLHMHSLYLSPTPRSGGSLATTRSFYLVSSAIVVVFLQHKFSIQKFTLPRFTNRPLRKIKEPLGHFTSTSDISRTTSASK